MKEISSLKLVVVRCLDQVKKLRRKEVKRCKNEAYYDVGFQQVDVLDETESHTSSRHWVDMRRGKSSG
jgi:hypothetical protein